MRHTALSSLCIAFQAGKTDDYSKCKASECQGLNDGLSAVENPKGLKDP